MNATSHRLFLFGLGVCLLAAGGGCAEENESDAYGNFETDEVTVSNEVSGQLLRFGVEEGERLPAGTISPKAPIPGRTAGPLLTESGIVGLVDTTRLALRRRELRARRQATRARAMEVEAQASVLEQELQGAQREFLRTRTLYEGNATTERQRDQAGDQVRVLERRIAATHTQKESIAREAQALTDQIAQIEERIRKSYIVNPLAGTVLATYAEAGEFIQVGQPLYKVASLDTMILRAYVSGAQLSNVTVGQRARVLIDESSGGQRVLPGRVAWVASEAEFTPTPIQTREERVDLVYAVKVRVPNSDGAIKIGMPGEVEFLEKATKGEVADTRASASTKETERN